MKIELKEISIKDVVNGYNNCNEEGVYGYGGKLNIRPKYQREFIYKPQQQAAVIDTVMNNFPLNVMYWVRNQDDTFELLDGQQRTLSICEYIDNKFSFKDRTFNNLQKDEQEKLLNYKLLIYFCEGEDKEKLDWFEKINIAGEKLTTQELRNAIYSGTWVTDAKRYFSKTGCAAFQMGKDYLSGTAIRQDYLETVIKWINDDNVVDYMSANMHNINANELRLYFESVINWVKVIFPNYRKEMKGVGWGYLYNDFKDKQFDAKALEIEVKRLMQDDDVTRKSGIYEYLLSNNEKHLNIRAFTDSMKRKIFEEQEGICAKCGVKFNLEEMEADHITPWHEGGKTILENCQMLCKHCNRRKGGR